MAASCGVGHDAWDRPTACMGGSGADLDSGSIVVRPPQLFYSGSNPTPPSVLEPLTSPTVIGSTLPAIPKNDIIWFIDAEVYDTFERRMERRMTASFDSISHPMMRECANTCFRIFQIDLSFHSAISFR